MLRLNPEMLLDPELDRTYGTLQLDNTSIHCHMKFCYIMIGCCLDRLQFLHITPTPTKTLKQIC